METRPLDRFEIRVTPLAFGGDVFGCTAGEATSFLVLDAIVDKGFDLIDAADIYPARVEGNRGSGRETILGKRLAAGNGIAASIASA